jgi:ribosome biogenesis protein Nip4
MKAVNDFIRKCNSRLKIDKHLVIKRLNRYYLLRGNMKPKTKDGFFYAGAYLGKTKDRTFFPSFNLLAMIARTKANKVVVDTKTEWLFICGRDVFKQGIIATSGTTKKGNYTLIINQHDECLGFGRILHNLDEKTHAKEPIIMNISDIGDFLRRER